MINKSLEELIKESITDVKSGKIDKRVFSFVDYGNKYAVQKPRVSVKLELGNGVVAKLDITDFFEKEIN